MVSEVLAGRRPTVSDGAPSVLLAIALLAYQSLRVLAQLAAARMLGPTEYGAWVVGATVLSYVAFIQLGTSSALPRVVPEKLAVGRKVGADRTLLAAWRYTLLTALGAAIVIALVTTAVAHGAVAFGIGLGLAFLGQQLFGVAQAADTAVQAMRRLTLRYAGAALGCATLPVLGAALWGKAGLAVGFGTAWLAAARSRSLPDPRVAGGGPDRGAVLALVRVGLPITLAGVLFSMVTSIDRLVIAKMLGLQSSGLYGVAAVAAGSAIVFQQGLAMRFMPHLAERSAARETRAVLLSRAGALSRRLVVWSLGYAVLFAAAYPPFVRTFLPEYVPTIHVAIVLVVACAVLGASSGHANLLLATGETIHYVYAQAAAVVVTGALVTVTASLTSRLDLIATASGVGYLALTVMVVVATHRVFRTRA
jgi:O-antigen/teichoic acid export membrane protein